MKKRGFTLIELLVVIAIIGILASIVLTSLGQSRKKAREAAVREQMTSLRSEIELYRLRTNSLGPTGENCSEGMWGDTNINRIVTAISENSGQDPECHTNGTDWAIGAALPATGGWICLDKSTNLTVILPEGSTNFDLYTCEDLSGA